jgi:putative RNA 2'-phosphotransferase
MEMTASGASKELQALSKFLSYVLRHRPDEIGLTLDAEGWADVEELLVKSASAGKALTRPLLEEIVRTSDKQRFAWNEDRSALRANQGHSVTVHLDHPVQCPPEVLFHGTAQRFLESILAQGLHPAERHDVHLSASLETAVAVGRRHGKPAVLKVRAKALWDAGAPFRLTPNGVWLVAQVPPEYLERVD